VTELGVEPPFRVGHAYDVHAFSDDLSRPLVLGGVSFPDQPGLAGHSDADVVAHVCIDALLGAAGLGDIGQQFPEDDPSLAGANSLRLLADASARVRAAGWNLANIDCSVVLDQPRLVPVKVEMEAALSDAAGGPVTVSGRTTEGLGALGRGEGIAAWAVALVYR